VDGDYESMLRESRALLDMRVADSLDTIATLGLLASAEFRAGNIAAALATTNRLAEVLRQFTKHPHIHIVILMHALILEAIGESETAAIVSVPRREQAVVFLFARQAADLRRRLESRLGAERLSELRQHAHDMTPEELISIAIAAEARHFDSIEQD
jgi:hypothetical protein